MAPGAFNLVSPANYSNSSIPTPIELQWGYPSYGENCANSSQLQFSIFLSQTYPPQYYGDTTSNSLSLATLSPGYWYWTIQASNDELSTLATETRSLLVCNPGSPAAPSQLFPLNGDYVADVQFNISFYGPGSFGTICQPEIPYDYYRVRRILFLFF